MTEIELAKWIVMSALGGIVWFLKRTLDKNEDRVTKLEQDQQRIREEYLHKTEFKDFKLELRGWFEEIKTDIRNLREPRV